MDERSMLVARTILDKTVATLRFYRCSCGNIQPFELGRGKPDCESCGKLPPSASTDEGK